MGYGFIVGLSSSKLDTSGLLQAKRGQLQVDSAYTRSMSSTNASLMIGQTNSYHTCVAKNQITAYNGNTSTTLKLNENGGTVEAPSFTATSSREKKENIVPYTLSALDIINNTDIVSFNYKGDKDKIPYVGFISEDTQTPLSTPDHKHMSVNSCIGILLKAVQELNQKIEEISNGSK